MTTSTTRPRPPVLCLALLVLLALPMLPSRAQEASPQPLAPRHFVPADHCVACHDNLTTPRGEDASMGLDWGASMMAHSSRDPYWQASVRREVMDHPGAGAAIEAECAKCHMPMARFEAHLQGGEGEVFALLPGHRPGGTTGPGHPLAPLAADGVSCAVCHQIQPDRLGERESFVAGFTVAPAPWLTPEPPPAGEARPMLGPFEVDAGRATVMRSASRFQPTAGSHVQSSELCATCHTLFTHSLDAEGNVVGELPEQVPYLEWRHSAYADAMSCQQCHMPVVEGEMAITGVLGQPRPEVSRHVFRGGNFFVPRMLDRYRADLGVTAPTARLAATAEETRRHLQESSATVTVEGVRVVDGRLEAEIAVESFAGHKLPTAYPSRRAWLHLTVIDGGGRTVFESGALRPDGAIAGNDNDTDPRRYEPHYTVIDSPQQVQIYEAILGDPEDRVTTGLLTAVRYLKDNRLLPTGFDKATASEDVAVHGAARRDDAFTGGGHRLRLAAPLPAGSAGPWRVTAELWYQPIAHRWARNLADHPAPETDRFVGYFDELADRSAVRLASGTREVGGD